MKFAKYNFSTLGKITTFLMSKEYLVGGLIGAATSCLLGLLSPLSALYVACGVSATSVVAPLLDAGARSLILKKQEINQMFMKRLQDSMTNLKPSVKKMIEPSIIINKKIKQDHIEKINADLLKGMFCNAIDEFNKEPNNLDAQMSAAANRDCMLDIEPIVLHYNSELSRAAGNTAEQNKIMGNFETALSLNLAGHLGNHNVEYVINNTEGGCLWRSAQRLMFM